MSQCVSGYRAGTTGGEGKTATAYSLSREDLRCFGQASVFGHTEDDDHHDAERSRRFGRPTVDTSSRPLVPFECSSSKCLSEDPHLVRETRCSLSAKVGHMGGFS